MRLSDVEDVKGERPAHRDVTPTSSDRDGPENEEDAPPSPRTPPKSQYELMRDNNFEHLRHEAADDQRATQRLRFRPNLLGENAIADNGILESVTCINFMCHVRLHCELGPLLNFIVGENGSGKSAILTAITLCLGGKASSTNRGGSLKSFIKEGCERAVLAVKIKNRGQDAYKPDIYGESIIVERHFSKSGTSGFRVKTALGQTYSTKKQEVDELVEYYALQVDNPLNILSQDNARQFLNSSTKAQKYKFFIEGVQLQQLDNDYRLISESLEQMVAKVPDQEERVKHAEADLEKAKRLMEQLEGNRQVRLKLRTLRYQLAWAQVVQEERDLSKREEDLAAVNIRVSEAQQEAEAKNQALLLADEKVERAEEAVRLIKEEEDQIHRRVEDANDRYKRLKAEVSQLHIQEREAHQALKNKTEEIKRTEERIAAEQQRLEAANGQNHTIKLRERDEAKEELAQIEKDMAENKTCESELKSKQTETALAMEKIDEEILQKREEISRVESRIQSLESDRGSVYAAYEPQVPKLLEMIARETSFETKPIGPLGTYVQLLQPRWSAILEATFGSSLNAFLVTCKRDEKILWGMINKLGIKKCPVFICGKQPLDLEGKEPDPEYDTILRVLKIDNLMVRDQLIINHMIEQVILVPERVRAQQIMFDGAPPRNVKACLSFHDHRHSEGLRLVKGSAGISTSPVRSNPHLQPRMKTDLDAQIALLRESLRHLESEYRALSAEKRRLQQEESRHKNGLDQLKQAHEALKDRQKTIMSKIDNLEIELDEFKNDGSRLQGFQDHLAEVMKDRDHHGMQYGMLSAQKQDKNAEVEEAQKRLKEEKLQMKDFEERYRKAEAKLRQARDMRHVCLVEKNEIIAQIAELEEQQRTAERRRSRQEANVQHMIKEAQKISKERVYVPEGETYKSIEQQYNALRRRLQVEEERAGMDEQQVHAYLAQAKAVRDKVVADLESIKRVNERLRETLTLRLEKWRKFQRYISSQSRANFIYLLSERGFRGRLLLDHERKALDLQVEPDRTEKRAAGRSTKTLSGGEKSFSSICLLLAIWEAMGSPLRCLDEFDVFMDNVNRAISTNMLVSFCPRQGVHRAWPVLTKRLPR